MAERSIRAVLRELAVWILLGWVTALSRGIRNGGSASGACGNRRWVRFRLARQVASGELQFVEYQITARELAAEDAYSREELYRMLRTVRLHEAQQRWKVPEPDDTPRCGVQVHDLAPVGAARCGKIRPCVDHEPEAHVAARISAERDRARFEARRG